MLLKDDHLTCIGSQDPWIGVARPVANDTSYHRGSRRSSDDILYSQENFSNVSFSGNGMNYRIPRS
jgi:hypothetical protein